MTDIWDPSRDFAIGSTDSRCTGQVDAVSNLGLEPFAFGGWNAAGAGLGRSSLRDGSCGLRAYTQWLGVTFHDRGSTHGFLAIRNSRQDQKYSMLDSLKGWFVIRVREDGLQRNAGGKKQVGHLRSLQRESGRLLHEPHRVMRFGSVKLIQNKALRPREPPLVAG